MPVGYIGHFIVGKKTTWWDLSSLLLHMLLRMSLFLFLNVLPFKKCSCAVEFMALNSIVHNLIIGIWYLYLYYHYSKFFFQYQGSSPSRLLKKGCTQCMNTDFVNWLFNWEICINWQVEKNVFVIFYSGDRAKNKILKICDAFGANRYPFADDLGKQLQMIIEVWMIFFKGFFPVFY